MLIGRDVDEARLGVAELKQVQGREVAGGVVEEHVFGAGIRRVDLPRRRAGVPVVDGGVILDAGIGGGPGGVADLVPEVAGLQGPVQLAIGAADQVPLRAGLDRAQEVVGDPNGVVRVLAGDREIGVGIPVGVIGVELDVLEALMGELDHALDIVVRNLIAARGLDGLLQGGVLLGVVAIVAGAFAIHAGLHHGLHGLLDNLGAGDERGDLLLLLHLPVDIGLDVRMVGVDHHHLGGAARGAARLDGARRTVADLQEGHEAGGAAAARQALVLAAQGREVGAGARAILEEARLAHPQIHDAALVHQIVGDGLDEAGVGLGMLVGGFGLGQLAREGVHIVMALAGAVDAIGPMQAGVEPLR